MALDQEVCGVASNEVQASKVRDSGIIAKGYAGFNAVSGINSGEVAKARVERVSPGGADSEAVVKLRGDSDLGERGRAGSRLPEHDTV